MAKILEYFAPDTKITPSPVGAAAYETNARRIGPLFNEMAQTIKQSEKAALWPLDMLALIEGHKAGSSTSGSGGGSVREQQLKYMSFRVVGGTGNFGGPTENFSDDPTQDYQPTRSNPKGLSTGEFGVGYDTHGQISRGAGTLGNMLGDGGYAAAADPRKLANGGYPYFENADGTVGGWHYNQSPAQAALEKLNAERDAYDQKYTDGLVATRDYWTQYYGGKGSQYQTDQTYNQAIADSVRNQGGPPPAPSAPSLGLLDTLSSWISGGSVEGSNGL